VIQKCLRRGKPRQVARRLCFLWRLDRRRDPYPVARSEVPEVSATFPEIVLPAPPEAAPGPGPCLSARWLGDGWFPARPPSISEETACIDAELCLDLECPRCSHAGMCYVPYRRRGKYRFLAACPACGEEQEP